MTEATAEAVVVPVADPNTTLAQVMRTFSLLPIMLDLVGPDATPTPLPTTVTDEVADVLADDGDAEAPADEADTEATEAAE